MCGRIPDDLVRQLKTKLDKKLKIIDLQMKKMRLDQQQADKDPDAAAQQGQGHVLSRNELLERIIGAKNQKAQNE
jgi:hypothetical protein